MAGLLARSLLAVRKLRLIGLIAILLSGARAIEAPAKVGFFKENEAYSTAA